MSKLYYEPDTGIFRRKFRYCVKEVGTKRSDGYISIRYHGVDYLAHRLAFFFMEGRWPNVSCEIDHINKIRDDNRWDNLREMTIVDHRRLSKCSNRDLPKYIIGFKGKFKVQYHTSGERTYLGLYDTLEEAQAALRCYLA